MERTEALLIDDLREGDMTALAILVEKYKRLVYRLAIQITKNHEDANDVMQDTFLKVYESIHSFRQEAAFETWLYRIVVNHAMNLVKRRKRRRESSLSAASEAEIHPDVRRTADLVNNPHLNAERKELQKWVTQAVDSLPVKHRTVVILHEFEGLTHAEIASILNCSEGTVRSRLHYARNKLRELLKPYVDSTEFPLKR
ncbi:sigma-70 family RNA polymerase sigma factor [Candidatus Poribacteria bacterium]|nr:sigma-70 family RNA polymerase sigma factor [Candidatus Poribacteria bacterium]